MALTARRLEDCDLDVEALSNDDWLVKFTAEGYEWLAYVVVRDGRLLQSSISLSEMRIENGMLVPFSYIEEQGQEQRVLNAISHAMQR